MSHGARARSKAIGEDVEALVVDGLPLEAVESDISHHDAVAASSLGWVEAVAAPFAVSFVGCLRVPEGELVEVKAVARRTSNGADEVPGRFYLKGHDEGQHDHLVDAGGYYALAVYEPVEGRDSRELLAVTVLPADVLDAHVAGRWYDLDRAEETAAKLSWKDLVDEAVVADALEQLEPPTAGENDDALDDGYHDPADDGSGELVLAAAEVADRLEDEGEAAAPDGDVVASLADEAGVDHARAERALEKAVRRGEVYRPVEGEVRAIANFAVATDGGGSA